MKGKGGGERGKRERRGRQLHWLYMEPYISHPSTQYAMCLLTVHLA